MNTRWSGITRLPILVFDPIKAKHWAPLVGLIFLLFSVYTLHRHVDLAWIRAEIENGAYWRLLTGQLVHNNIYHLILNSSGAIIIFWIVRDAMRMRGVIAHSFVIAILTAVMLYQFETELEYYVGLSAVLHGLLAAYAVIIFPTSSWTCLLILVALAIKLLIEGNAGPAPSLIGIRVATEAHYLGVASGLATGTAHLYWSRSIADCQHG